MDPLTLALEAAPKALVYGAVLLSVGACAARALLRFRVARSVSADATSSFEAALARLLLASAVALVLALPIRAWAHTAASFGVADSLTWENLELIAWESRWGEGWQWQMAGALILLALAWSAPRWPRPGWTLAGLAGVAMCYLLPLLGHAEGEPDRVLLHGSHLLAGGIWLGTLVATAVATGATTMTRDRPPPVGRQMLEQFSPVALSGAALLALTGAIAAWWYLGSIGNLVATSYGRLLLTKLILVAGVASLGFLNWRRHRVPLADAGSPAARTALVAAEIALAIAVVLVTAILTETEHP